MNYFRPAIRAMHGYAPGEQPQDKPYVKLNTNENPYPPSPKVYDAIRAVADQRLRLYPDPMSVAVRRKLGEVYGFTPEEIIVGQGGDDILNLIVRACADKGDRVASLYPSYTLYSTLAELQEAEFVGVDTVAELPAVQASVNVVCNPNAPTGLWTPAEELDGIARKLTGLLVIDEAYADFAKRSCFDLARRHGNVIVVRTLSKSFSLAGMRLGYGVSQPHNIEQLFKVKESYNLDRVSQAVALAALDDLPHAEANVDRVVATRVRLKDELRAMGLDVFPSESNFVFVRVPAAAEVKQMLMDRGVLVRYLALAGYEDYLRISIGTDDEIDRLLAELRAVLTN
jgi:histidinol-phosphate aminotransferase